jgi:hypothetical protein
VQDDQAVVEDDDRQPAGDRKVVIGGGLGVGADPATNGASTCASSSAVKSHVCAPPRQSPRQPAT